MSDIFAPIDGTDDNAVYNKKSSNPANASTAANVGIGISVGSGPVNSPPYNNTGQSQGNASAAYQQLLGALTKNIITYTITPTNPQFYGIEQDFRDIFIGFAKAEQLIHIYIGFPNTKVLEMAIDSAKLNGILNFKLSYSDNNKVLLYEYECQMKGIIEEIHTDRSGETFRVLIGTEVYWNLLP